MFAFRVRHALSQRIVYSTTAGPFWPRTMIVPYIAQPVRSRNSSKCSKPGSRIHCQSTVVTSRPTGLAFILSISVVLTKRLQGLDRIVLLLRFLATGTEHRVDALGNGELIDGP